MDISIRPQYDQYEWERTTQELESVFDVIKPKAEDLESVLKRTGLIDLAFLNPCSDISPTTQAVTLMTLRIMHEQREGGIEGRISKDSLRELTGMAARRLYAPEGIDVPLLEDCSIIDGILAAEKILQERLPNVKKQTVSIPIVEDSAIKTDDWLNG